MSVRLARPPRTPVPGPASVQATGRCVHADDEATPLHHARIELFFAWGDREAMLGRGVTDGQGRFAIPARLPAAWEGGRLALRVLQLRPPMTAQEPAERGWRVAARARSEVVDRVGEVRFGDVVVPWWERRAGPGVRLAPLAGFGGEPEPEDLPVQSAWLSRAILLGLAPEPPPPVGGMVRDARGVWGRAPEPEPPPAPEPPGPPPATLGDLLGSCVGWTWEADDDGVLRVALPDALRAEGEPRGAWARCRDGAVIACGWEGASSALGEPGFAGSEAVVRVIARRAACVDGLLGQILLPLEALAVPAFRHLRAGPLAPLLLPRLRGAAWLVGVLQDALGTHADLLDLLPPAGPGGWSSEVDRVARSATPGTARLLPGSPVARAVEAVHAELTAWLATPEMAARFVGDVETARFQRELMGHAGRMGPDDTDPRALAAVTATALTLLWGLWPFQREVLRAELASPGGTLRLAQVGGAWAPAVDPDEAASRWALAAALRPLPEASLDADRLGDVDPVWRRRWASVADALVAAGLPRSAVPASVGP
jgi:hypothetical protein